MQDETSNRNYTQGFQAPISPNFAAQESPQPKRSNRLPIIIIVTAIAIIAIIAIIIIVQIIKQQNTISIGESGWQELGKNIEGDTYFTFAAQLKNTSKDRVAKNVVVNAEVIDSNNKNVATIDGICVINYLAPEDMNYCAGSVIKDSDYSISKINFKINSSAISYEPSIEGETVLGKDYNISEIEENKEDAEISCTIKNNAKSTITNPYATVVFYKNGKLIGGTSSAPEWESLAAGEDGYLQFTGLSGIEYDEYKISVTGN